MQLRPRRSRPARFAPDPLAPRLSAGQLTALVVGLIVGLLLAPVGAQAASALLNVAITDPANPARQAHVDAAGNLQVSSGDDPARLAFQTEISINLPSDNLSGSDHFSVPAGKRLVIRYVSALALLPTGQKLIHLGLTTDLGDTSASHRFVPVFTGSSGPRDFFLAAQDTQVHADPGTVVTIFAGRSNSSDIGAVNVDVSGYLIDCTVGACG